MASPTAHILMEVETHPILAIANQHTHRLLRLTAHQQVQNKRQGLATHSKKLLQPIKAKRENNQNKKSFLVTDGKKENSEKTMMRAKEMLLLQKAQAPVTGHQRQKKKNDLKKKLSLNFLLNLKVTLMILTSSMNNMPFLQISRMIY